MKHRYAAAATVAALGLAVSACGSSTAQGGDDKTLAVGLLLNKTGTMAEQYGNPFANGFAVGLDEVQSSGYLNGGLKITTQTKDTQSAVPQAVTGFNQLAQAGDQVVISDSLSTIGKAVSPLANQKSIVFLSGSGSTLPNDQGYAFHMVDINDPMHTLGAHMYDVGCRRIATIVDGDNETFPGLEQAMASGFAKAGGAAPVASQTISETATDFSSVLTNIAKSAPDCVFIADLPQEAGNVVSQLRNTGGLQKVKLFGDVSWGPQTYEVAKSAADGATFAEEWAPGDAKSETFESLYKRKYGNEPTTFAALGYQEAWLVAVAAKESFAKDGKVSASGLRDAIPAASTSADLAKHSILSGFKMDAAGDTTYKGTLTTFSSTGQIVSLGATK